MPRLSQKLGGPPLWIKRDDCTGLATGGNKTRKLEFLMGDALAQGADTVLCFGALQSNHVRQTAAAAARLGLACHAVLTDLVSYREPAYDVSGNLLLDELLGAEVHVVSDGEAAKNAVREIVEDLRSQGRVHYTIPVGGSNAIGALGYVECALELSRQVDESGISVGTVACAISSAGTQAGLVAGFASLARDTPVQGFNVYSADPAGQRSELAALCAEVCGKLGISTVDPDRLRISNEVLGSAYGDPTRETVEAVRLVARSEGILLDPVYSGKAMAGLIGMIRRGELSRSDPVVFLHTGGSAALFAYRDALTGTR
jgi:L-cysteate sulfo-lyase